MDGRLLRGASHLRRLPILVVADDDSRLRHRRSLAPGRHLRRFTIAAAAGFPYGCYFAFQTFNANGARDAIPNTRHPVLRFPSRCDTYLLDQKALDRPALPRQRRCACRQRHRPHLLGPSHTRSRRSPRSSSGSCTCATTGWTAVPHADEPLRPDDSYNLEDSHVLPALIRKDPRRPGRPCRRHRGWGTGTPRRGVRAMTLTTIFALKHYIGEQHVNVGVERTSRSAS